MLKNNEAQSYRLVNHEDISQSDGFWFFGAGHISQKTSDILDCTKLIGIFDSSENLVNTQQLGCSINLPTKEKLSLCDLIVICSTAIDEIFSYLVANGVEPEKIYISPVLEDRISIVKLENLRTSLLFSSGSVFDEQFKLGGGLFEFNLDAQSHQIKRLHEGSVYGIARLGKNFAFVDTNRGIFVYENKRIEKLFELPKSTRAHGMCFHEQKNLFSLSCSYRDSILFLNDAGQTVDEIFISKKFNETGEPQHHVNDHCVVDNYLYVSMFSISGNWKRNVFDGGIMQINMDDLQDRCVLTNSLLMPHNIEKFGNEFHVLDSFRGNLSIGLFETVASFPGFARGLDRHKNLFAIGQSKNRNHSKLKSLSTNISIDCGLVFFDNQSKLNRQIVLPSSIGEIHSVKFSKCEW